MDTIIIYDKNQGLLYSFLTNIFVHSNVFFSILCIKNKMLKTIIRGPTVYGKPGKGVKFHFGIQ